VDWAHGYCGGDEECIQKFLLVNLLENIHMDDQGDWRMSLKCTLRRWIVGL
jgi:hypothetical protein